MLLNPFFLVLGWIARLTRLPLIAIYHLARLLCGAGLLFVVWEFLKTTLSAPFARRLALLCVCFASGLGWLPLPWGDFPANGCPAGPIDLWQPEAITFLSLLLSPLFCFSLALQIGILLLLFKGEQSGKIHYALSAGLCGFLLGLTHTYDIISISAVWLVYLFISVTRHSRFPTTDQDHALTASSSIQNSCLQALVAGACTVPAVAYIYHQLQTEATFLKRANVVTASALPFWVLLGYGLTLALAVYAVLRSTKKDAPKASLSASQTSPDDLENTPNLSNSEHSLFMNRASLHLLMAWAVTNILVSYLPVSKFPFQRKMLQGAHLPIAILAGCGLACLLMQPKARRSLRSISLAAAAAIVILSITNLRFIIREINNYQDNHVQSGQRAYLNPGELEALRWVESNTPPATAIQPLPWIILTPEHKLGLADMTLANIVPGTIHRNVYCGHWGETPDYGSKLSQLMRFQTPAAPEEFRIEMLRKMHVQYLLFSQKHNQPASDVPFQPFLSDSAIVPSYLKLVHSNPDADVYKVNVQ